MYTFIPPLDSYPTIHHHSRAAQVPVSLVYRKDTMASPAAAPSTTGGKVTLKGEALPLPAHGPLPCLLYGYGSYGVCIDPVFDYKRVALLDRGVVYAIAHIRGGGELGRGWYEDEVRVCFCLVIALHGPYKVPPTPTCPHSLISDPVCRSSCQYFIRAST